MPSVFGDPGLADIGAAVDQLTVQRRDGDGGDGTIIPGTRYSGQAGRDHFPGNSPVGGFVKSVGSKIKRSRIFRIEDNRGIPVFPVVSVDPVECD